MIECCYVVSQNAQSLEQLIRVSQCDCRVGDIHRMETIINDKLRSVPGQDTITHFTLLRAIVDAFAALSDVDLSNHVDKMGSKLVMCLCHAELLNVSVSCLPSLLPFVMRWGTKIVSRIFTRLLLRAICVAHCN